MGVEVDGSITGGVVAGAQAVSDTLESLTSSGTFAGETVTPFQPADLQQQGSPDCKCNEWTTLVRGRLINRTENCEYKK